MGCCTSRFKYDLEDYFKICLNANKIRHIKLKEAYELLISPVKDEELETNLEEDVIKDKERIEEKFKYTSNTNKPSKLQKEVLNHINQAVSKEKYQEYISNFFIDSNTNNSKNSSVKINGGNITNFPDISTFNKMFFDKLYNSNKYTLIMNLFSLFNHHTTNKTSHENSTYYFYKLLAEKYGDVTYANVKNSLMDYLTITLTYPYESVYCKTDKEETRSEVRYILENEINEDQRIEFLDSALKNYENLKLKSNHDDHFTKDSSIVSYENFRFIIGDSISWSWDIFKLRDIYLVKFSSISNGVRS